MKTLFKLNEAQSGMKKKIGHPQRITKREEKMTPNAEKWSGQQNCEADMNVKLE